jgi:hypothetical protein
VFSAQLLWENRGVKWGRRILLVVVTCGVLAVVVGLLWPGEREPVYQGKKLSEWLEAGASKYDDAPEEQLARIAVKQMGTNALPYLMEAIAYEPSALKRKLIQAVKSGQARPTRVGTFIIRKLTAGDRHAEFAEYGFRVLGATASPVVPELARRLNNTNGYVAVRAMNALVFVGEAGLAPLLAVLADERHFNRIMVARSVLSLYLCTRTRTNAAAALPVLIRCLKDNDEGVVRYAAATLGFLKIESWICVPALTELTHHTNSFMRRSAARALGQFGKEAQSALPVLLDGYKDSDAGVREGAAEAVRNITQEMLEKKGGP